MEWFQCNWIHWIWIRKWWYSRQEEQTEEDPTESVDDDASAFELNFHDDTLTTANESQNISERPNSDQSFSDALTKKKITWKNETVSRKQALQVMRLQVQMIFLVKLIIIQAKTLIFHCEKYPVKQNTEVVP